MMNYHQTAKWLLITQKSRKLLSTDASSKLKRFESIPGPKPLPLLGNLWRYLPVIGDYKPDTLFENAKFNKERYGPIVREQLTKNHTILHLFDPDDIKTFFRQDEKYPYRRSHRALLKYRHDRPDLYRDGGLFPENGPNWYRQRNQFQQYLMSKSRIASNSKKLDEISFKVVKLIETHLDGDNSTDIENFESILYHWGLESSLYLFLECKLEGFDKAFVDEFIQQLHNTLIALEKTEIQTDRWIKHPNKCPYYKMLVDSQEFLYDFVSKQVKSLDKALLTEASFIHNWLFIDKLDHKDIVSFVIDSLMAGLHTTTYTIAWLLYHLSQSDDLSKSLRKEINSQIPNQGFVTIDQIDKLSLLRDVLKETLRLNPVSIGTGRVTQDNVAIRNYEIPIGSMIIAQTQAICRDENVYADCEKFKPDRWATYRACPRHLRPSPFASLPFGFGSRACIGQRLAELQIKILVTRLLQRFDIKVNKFRTKTVLVHTIDGHIGARIKQIR